MNCFRGMYCICLLAFGLGFCCIFSFFDPALWNLMWRTELHLIHRQLTLARTVQYISWWEGLDGVRRGRRIHSEMSVLHTPALSCFHSMFLEVFDLHWSALSCQFCNVWQSLSKKYYFTSSVDNSDSVLLAAMQYTVCSSITLPPVQSMLQ